MSSTFTAFTPSTSTLFSFQPTIAGALYNVTTPWNIFKQGYYVNVTDLSGNPVLYRSLCGGGPLLQAQLSWALGWTYGEPGTATVTLPAPHNVAVGAIASARISATGTAFDGVWSMLAVTTTALSYSLSNPNQATPLSGSFDQPLNLVQGAVAGGWLYYHEDTEQFEYASS